MLYFVLKDPHQVGDGYPVLVHTVPVANSNLVVFDAVEVYCHTIWGANLILTPITPPNTLGVIVLSVQVLAQLVVY